MRSDLVKGIIQLEPSGPPFTLRPPFGNDPAFAFGLTDLPIEYEPSAGKHAENMETIIEPAIDAEHNDGTTIDLVGMRFRNIDDPSGFVRLSNFIRGRGHGAASSSATPMARKALPGCRCTIICTAWRT